jgi:hypothetical protein
MGSIGGCYDGAVRENLHVSLKKASIHCQPWPTRAQARSTIFE